MVSWAKRFQLSVIVKRPLRHASINSSAAAAILMMTSKLEPGPALIGVPSNTTPRGRRSELPRRRVSPVLPEKPPPPVKRGMEHSTPCSPPPVPPKPRDCIAGTAGNGFPSVNGGSPTNGAAGDSHGLRNMRHRIESCAGGRFKIDTQPGRGTNIQMRVELPRTDSRPS